MKNNLLLIVFITLIATPPCLSSQLKLITLSELNKRSNLIVLGKVINVEGDHSVAKITLKIATILKGKANNKIIRFTLLIGGRKGFDPNLEIGQTGVFFLKTDGNIIVKAYPGSYAIFQVPYEVDVD